MNSIIGIERLYLQERGKLIGEFTEGELREMHDRNQLTGFHRVSADNRNWESARDALRRIEEQRAIALAPAPEPPPVPVGQIVSYRPFPVGLLIVLHFATLGIWSFCWLPLMHGRLPRKTASDPTGGRALSLMLLPFYATWYSFFCFPNLANRLNALREHYGMIGDIPLKPVLIMCIFRSIVRYMMFAGALALVVFWLRESPLTHAVWFFFVMPQVLTLVNYFFFVPQFLTVTQSTFNQIAEAQQQEFMNGYARQ